MKRISDNSGFTLVELVVMIVVIGIISAIAVFNIDRNVESAQFSAAKAEMDQIARSIAGNPDLYEGGARSDFGYIGDIGALPDSIGDLINNIHSFGTWRGPYLNAGTEADYRLDPWGTQYSLNDTMIISTGSGSTITKAIAPSRAALVANELSGRISDATGDSPGTSFRDSVDVILFYPDGAGGISNISINPDETGAFSYTGIPIGNHRLQIISIPDADTVNYELSFVPGRNIAINIVFPADLW